MSESIRVVYQRLIPYKYKTTQPLVFKTELRPAEDIVHPYFTISKDGTVSVPAGYAWDGPSGPAIDTKNFMRGSLAHDIPYQANQLCLPLPSDWKEKTDKTLQRMCLEDGMTKLRAWWVYTSVKAFGRGRPRDLNPFDEILVAP